MLISHPLYKHCLIYEQPIKPPAPIRVFYLWVLCNRLSKRRANQETCQAITGLQRRSGTAKPPTHLEKIFTLWTKLSTTGEN